MLDGRLGQLTKVPTAGIMDLGGGSTQVRALRGIALPRRPLG